MNIIINRNSFGVVGVNRAPSPGEFIVENVTDIRKDITITTKIAKTNIDGNELYYLPQPDLEVITQVTKTVETTEVTQYPIMVKESIKIPLLDANGKQVEYQPTTRGETTDITDEPVMEIVQNEDNIPIEKQKVDVSGKLLYWGQTPSGNPIVCFTTEEVDVQKTDDAGTGLYHTDVVEEVVNREPQPYLEITKLHDEWTEDLEIIEIEVDVPMAISLSESPGYFTYEEIEPSLSTLKNVRKSELYEEYQKELNGQVVSSLVGPDGLNYTFPYQPKNRDDYRSIGVTFALDANQMESIIGSDSHGKFYIQREDFVTLIKDFQDREVLLYTRMKQKESEVDIYDSTDLIQSVVW